MPLHSRELKVQVTVMSIANEKISFNQGLTSYRVKVQSFKHKMNTWKNGRLVFLKEFEVDGTNLRLELYPNGNEKENNANETMQYPTKKHILVPCVHLPPGAFLVQKFSEQNVFRPKSYIYK